jgi:hypothetical protein
MPAVSLFGAGRRRCNSAPAGPRADTEHIGQVDPLRGEHRPARRCGADHQRPIPVGEDLGGRPTKVGQALGQQPQRREAGGIGGKPHRDHPGEPQDGDQGLQTAQLLADQPLAAVGPARLDLDAGVGLKAHLRVGLGIDRAQQANPSGEQGVGTA